jgi:pimeloyl-ACP methyl ester carboxylesterase
VLDTTMTLTDGRSLAFTDLGAESGPLVFYFHGAPSSRLDLVAADDELAALGVRVVCPDRPGYGLSSSQPGRDRNGWAADVAALADHLGRERFAVTGISSGGPYAVTCAALLPDRVAAACVVAGVTDMTWPPSLDSYDELWITIMRLDDEAKAKAWCDEHLGADGSAMMAEMPELAPADQAWLEEPGIAERLSVTMAEAFRQGTGGFAQDLTIENRPWAFDTGAIVAPVRVVHGDADTLVPVAHSRHTAELIPGATLDIVPGHGHISMFGELPRWCSDLAAFVP